MPDVVKLIKDLVDAFNVHSYCSNVDTNFSVEGLNIVIPFRGNENSGRQYLEFMREQVIKEYFPTESAARVVFDLQSFPFNVNAGRWQQSNDDKGIVKFVAPVTKEVLFNFKCLFNLDIEKIITGQIIRELQNNGAERKMVVEYLEENIKTNVINRKVYNCLYSLSFNGNVGLMNNFVQKFQAEMEIRGYDFSGFWEMIWKTQDIYVQDVNSRDVQKVTKKTLELIGRDFEVPSSDDPTVRRYKNAVSDLILTLTGIPISVYHRDIYLNTSNEEYFAFIPEIKRSDGSSRYLYNDEAKKINDVFDCVVLSDIEGKTIGTRLMNIGGIYAFSNKQIELLITKIIESSTITEIDNGYGLVIEPEPIQVKRNSQSDIISHFRQVDNEPFRPRSGSTSSSSRTDSGTSSVSDTSSVHPSSASIDTTGQAISQQHSTLSTLVANRTQHTTSAASSAPPVLGNHSSNDLPDMKSGSTHLGRSTSFTPADACKPSQLKQETVSTTDSSFGSNSSVSPQLSTEAGNSKNFPNLPKIGEESCSSIDRVNQEEFKYSGSRGSSGSISKFTKALTRSGSGCSHPSDLGSRAHEFKKGDNRVHLSLLEATTGGITVVQKVSEPNKYLYDINHTTQHKQKGSCIIS
ncbi:MAG: hypothetical protein PV340_04260 [Wolbachia sp.]|nr:hypothetical protein [Wolbachia sp.]MDD9336085.1 hypothetical protein [Wolbachia sp.]